MGPGRITAPRMDQFVLSHLPTVPPSCSRADSADDDSAPSDSTPNTNFGKLAHAQHYDCVARDLHHQLPPLTTMLPFLLFALAPSMSLQAQPEQRASPFGPQWCLAARI